MKTIWFYTKIYIIFSLCTSIILICGTIFYSKVSYSDKELNRIILENVRLINKISDLNREIDLYKKHINELNNKVIEYEMSYIDENDLFWLAKNIYFEGRGETELGKIAIGMVVLNRVNSGQYPDSIEEVVKQKHQFEWYWDNIPDKINNSKAWKECLEISKQLLKGDIERDPTKGSLYYHSKKIKPNWLKNKQITISIGNHKFYN
jgi:spore germination cell wall hydrolase CwlJ-like protein